MDNTEIMDVLKSKLDQKHHAASIRDLSFRKIEGAWNSETYIECNYMFDSHIPIYFESHFYDRKDKDIVLEPIARMSKLMNNVLEESSLEYISCITDAGFDPRLSIVTESESKLFNKIKYFNVDSLACAYASFMTIPEQDDPKKSNELRTLCSGITFKYTRYCIVVEISCNKITMRIPGATYSSELLPSSSYRQTVITDALSDIGVYSEFIKKVRLYKLGKV